MAEAGMVQVLTAPPGLETPRRRPPVAVIHPVLERHSAAVEPLWAAASPLRVFGALWPRRFLISQLAWRDVRARYQGSMLGLSWAGLQPMLTLLVYVFVFRFIFRAPWQSPAEESPLGFALTLLTGLLTFSLGSEVLQRSPGLVLAQPNLVKRVRFPLEVLSPAALLGSCFQPILGLTLIGVAYGWLVGGASWHPCWLPIVLVPYLAFLLGCSWLLAALGTFFRDLGQMVAVGCQLLVFLTPVFYPLVAVPERYRPFIAWSPFAIAVENVRKVMLLGQPPDGVGLLVLGIAGFVAMHLGYAAFARARRSFADVT